MKYTISCLDVNCTNVSGYKYIIKGEKGWKIDSCEPSKAYKFSDRELAEKIIRQFREKLKEKAYFMLSVSL